MSTIKLTLWATLTAVLIATVQLPLFSWPPPGRLLNPTTGIWAGEGSGDLPPSFSLPIRDSAQVKYDSDRVPHVFARGDHDLYFLQGYVTARDRLFQMEIQSRKAEGTLSAVFGQPTLSGDRYYRRLGLSGAAAASLELMERDTAVRVMLTAYADGVNAYIAGLREADWPVEYKLLNVSPRKWVPMYSVLIMKLMAETLTAGSDDAEMTAVLRRFGYDTTSFLFPDYPSKEAPVFPQHGNWPQPTTRIPPVRLPTIGGTESAPVHAPVNEGVGSNNWVVGAARSATGYPILANDPHLHLTLPGIWYQIQLTSPGLNVYGVSVPGVPAVIIGFNEKIAWGLTNTYADVTDWYLLRFKDSSAREYRYNGNWVATHRRIDTILVKGGRPLFDTTVITGYGPVVPGRTASPEYGLAMKWLGASPSEELTAFYRLNRAADLPGFRHALEWFTVPAQTFVYADAGKHIGIVAAGKFPLKYKEQGKYIMDGNDTANEWHGWIPETGRPSLVDPTEGFVFSANQSLTDSTYPYYINWHFSPSERARRIRQRLASMTQGTADSMRNLQNDTYSVFAADALPYMLSVLHNRDLSPDQQRLIGMMKDWDYRFDSRSQAATFFNTWWGRIQDQVWTPRFGSGEAQLKRPSRDRTLQLLIGDPSSKWFDDPTTTEIETSADIIAGSFKKAVIALTTALGPPGERWEWARNKVTTIGHIGGIGRFGSGFIGTPGTTSTVNALSREFGPSWRMVVELGPQPKAFGILPGGSSGDPGSLYYDDQLRDWRDGRLHPLVFLRSAADPAARTVNVFPHL
jgi:penicillin amidase